MALGTAEGQGAFSQVRERASDSGGGSVGASLDAHANFRQGVGMAPTSLNRVQQSSDARYLATFVYASLAAAVVFGLIRYDRRAPLVYVDTKVVPEPARAGGDITVHRYVEWRRQCGGEASTEIVSPKGYVYRRAMTTPAVPAGLGYASVTTTWTLPADLLAEGDTIGTATYRGVIRFRDCGITSWILPLSISYQERHFDVRR